MTELEKVRHLHLVSDEKSFTDILIDQFEAVAPGQHAYLVAQPKGRKIEDVRQAERLVALDPESPDYLAFSRRLPALKSILVHSLNQPKAEAIAHAPLGASKVWLAWGGDFYQRCWSPARLYLPLTYSFIERSNGYRMQLGHWGRRAFYALRPDRNVFRGWASRFDYCAPVVPTEYEILRSATGFRARQAFFNYGSIEATLCGLLETRVEGDAILVANSCTPASNHADIFRALANAGGVQQQVVVPLSYGGSDEYREFVVRQGRRYLGDRFKAQTEYMPAPEYVRWVTGARTCIFGHVRQQGVGGILIALWQGSRVFLRPANPVYRHLVGLGFKVFAIDGDFSRSLRDAEIRPAEVDRHRELLAREYGETTVLRRTREILDLPPP